MLGRKDTVAIPSQSSRSLVDHGHTTSLLVEHQCLVGELLIIQNPATQPEVVAQVQEDVLVNQGKTELISRHWSPESHDCGTGLIAAGMTPYL